MPRRAKPKLVTEYLENISREGFEKHADIIRRFVKKRMGIYALYRRGKLYYAGLASDLRWRLNHHLKRREADEWDTFSVYLTIGDQHLRELESMVLRIMQPPGNKQLGKFSGARDLLKTFDKEIARKQRAERDRILGREPEEEEDGMLKRAISIRVRYKKKLFKARLRRDGRVRWNGKLFKTLSAAATAVRGRNTNGWWFWKYERSPGYWVPVDCLRNR